MIEVDQRPRQRSGLADRDDPPETNEVFAMGNIIRGLLAGWGASKLGGGCISTIVIFLILFWLLGYVF